MGFMNGQEKQGASSPITFACPPVNLWRLLACMKFGRTRSTLGSCPYKSCTIITMGAIDSVKDIHDRMPLILKPEAYEEWLDPGNKEPAKLRNY